MTIYRDGIESDKLVGLHVAFASAVARLEKPETPVLSYLSPNLMNLHTADGMVPFGQRAYKYKERQYLHGRTTLNGNVAAAAVSITLTDKVCRPNDIIICGDEAIELGASDDYLTFACTKSKFTGSDAAHSSGDNVYVFGTSYPESSNAPTAGPIKQTTEVTTSTDILMDSVKVSGSARYMQQYAEGNMDKILEYTAELTIDLKQQLQTRTLWSDYQAAVGDDTAGRMDGAYERIAATNYVDFSDGNITYADLQKMVRKCRRKGAKLLNAALFLPDYQHDIVSQWLLSYQRYEASQRAQQIFGANCAAIQIGQTLVDIIPLSGEAMDTEALLCSPENVGVGPKDASRVFHPEALGKKGDYDEVMIVGEYTCEWMLPYSHCYATSLAYGT